MGGKVTSRRAREQYSEAMVKLSITKTFRMEEYQESILRLYKLVIHLLERVEELEKGDV